VASAWIYLFRLRKFISLNKYIKEHWARRRWARRMGGAQAPPMVVHAKGRIPPLGRNPSATRIGVSPTLVLVRQGLVSYLSKELKGGL